MADGQKFVRFARNCVEAEYMIPARCSCCGGIKFLLIDGQERVRAIGQVSVEELRAVLSDAEAGRLPPFDPQRAN